MDTTTPRYWGSIEELGQPGGHEPSHGEFLTPPPQESITSMERRDFLKLLGATIFATSIGCSRRPIEKIIPYVNRPEEVIPGVANWYASTCGECSAACGTLVKTREARPIKIEGNPEHPLNRGGLCARGQASLLNLYDPDRLKHPAAVSRHDGKQEEVSWDAMDENLRATFKAIRQRQGKIAILTGSLTSPSTKALIDEFLGDDGIHVSWEAVVPEEVALAAERSFGEKNIPRYRFDQAEFILSFGADFLGTWLSPVEFAKGFAATRRADGGNMARFVTIASTINVTGTNADDHLSVAPGDELFVALALAHELIVKQGHRPAANGDVVSLLAPYELRKVAAAVGVDPAKLEALAAELWAKRGKGMILGGTIKGKESVALASVVNLLNVVLENDGAAIDWRLPSLQAQSSTADLIALAQEMQQGKIDAVIIADGDPLFTLPASSGFGEALKKIPLVVNCSERLNATSALSTHLCPGTHPLESWGDAMPQQGLVSIRQPAIAPLYHNRAFEDSLIAWGNIPAKSWHGYLMARWDKEMRGISWTDALKKGFVDLEQELRTTSARAPSRTFQAHALEGLPPLPKKSDGLRLALVPSHALYDGRFANNAWLQELPDPVAKITWDNFISLAPKTASELSLREGDVVRLSLDDIEVKLPVHLQPKLAVHTAQIAVGYGNPHAGTLGKESGKDVYPLQRRGKQLLEWTGAAITLSPTGERMTFATTQGHHSMEGRAIVFETTWDAFQQNPASGIEAPHALPSMWPVRDYKKERWGMAIDLNACNGCSACVIACQVENNVPVVGKDQVLKGREMHWLRIDRYYSGDEANPEVVHQPVLCQHCENAPCETVCPVVATSHSDDGLNMMTYNRCVGTRYCSNNCPYKVRRFNYFDYTTAYSEPLHLALNPDVTVRSRGVMEKCSFCIQRIQEKRHRATIDGRTLEDGEIKTACQQSCPADAIVFGDLNNPASKVAELAKKNKRGYHLLVELNTRPAVTYLSKIRKRA